MESMTNRPPRRGRPRRTPIEDIQPQAVEPQQAVHESMRPAMRQEMRDEDPRAMADRRAAEIMGHLGEIESGVDKFYIPLGEIPDGWDYNWKRKTIYNQEDPAYQVTLARGGWTPVPAGRHPGMMPSGWKGATIERDGMVLMERPMSITDLVRQKDRRAARDQVRVKEQQLSAAPPGTMEKEFSDPRTRPNIRKSYEAMPVPSDS